MSRQRETGQCLVAAAFGGIAALAVAGAATASAAWIMCMLLTALGGVLWAHAPRPQEQRRDALDEIRALIREVAQQSTRVPHEKLIPFYARTLQRIMDITEDRHV